MFLYCKLQKAPCNFIKFKQPSFTIYMTTMELLRLPKCAEPSTHGFRSHVRDQRPLETTMLGPLCDRHDLHHGPYNNTLFLLLKSN